MHHNQAKSKKAKGQRIPLVFCFRPSLIRSKKGRPASLKQTKDPNRKSRTKGPLSHKRTPGLRLADKTLPCVTVNQWLTPM